MKKRKIVALLASCFLILSLSACGNSTNDVEPTPSDAAQPPETIEPSTEPTTEPTAEPSGEPTTTPSQEPTTAPAEEPGEQVPTNKEPTTGATQEPTTTPPATTDPPAPVHTHSYSNNVTKQATCDTNGVITYTCSCGDSYTESIPATGHAYNGGEVVKEPTCAEAGGKVFTCTKCGAMYTEAIPANGNHNWETRHIDAYGYYESSGTHTVAYHRHWCGYEINSDVPNAAEIWRNHTRECPGSYSYWSEEVPNGDSKWVEVVPAHDETYCTRCGAIQ